MTKSIVLLLTFAAGIAVGRLGAAPAVVSAQSANAVFELRTYTAPEGKLANLHARFRDHTRRIFEKHGMKSIGYWTPADAPNSSNTLVYILQHASRAAAVKSWADFRADPEWVKVSAESQKDGPIVSKVESVFMDSTDYSPIR
jgi:hypothetical protein